MLRASSRFGGLVATTLGGTGIKKNGVRFLGTPSTQGVINDCLEEYTLGLVCGAACKAHPEKAAKHPHGEDAFFVDERIGAMGVADGVSMWAEVNVDAGLYSRELMRHTANEMGNQYVRDDILRLDPKAALEVGYKNSVMNVGTSTACVVALEETGILRAANIGDSGFIVLRPGAMREGSASVGTHWDMVYRSSDMQKFFNCPEQLGSGSPDRPARAETYTLPVETGDIVIVATDGLFDNLSDNELSVSLKKYAMQLEHVLPESKFELASDKYEEKLQNWCQTVASTLVDEAQLTGMSRTARTPFTKQAIRAGFVFEGGKLDDTAVLVGMVISKEE
uniref:Protein phosphatase n=1 Tax=Mucochytrium quahogii TaxID=96639 RepID=A0A7S2W6L4_9STRA|mmetsp:Transcript_9364/g.15273  ORF Transcript_9364/g.15273 Transcript_9364/m.15273 type:complete len:336 (-) Transcript_9364:81-1088(-)